MRLLNHDGIQVGPERKLDDVGSNQRNDTVPVDKERRKAVLAG